MKASFGASIGHGWRHWQPWIVGSLLVLSGNWAAAAGDAWLHGDLADPALRVFQCGLFLGCVVWLYAIRRTLWRPRTRYLSKDIPEPRPHLVLFLSSVDARRAGEDRTPSDFAWQGPLDDVIADLERYKEQPSPGYRNWPWEMPLRAIRHHAQGRVLRSVTLICSHQSLPDAPRFLRLVKCFEHGKLRDVEWFLLVNRRGQAIRRAAADEGPSDAGWDFEDFDQLSQALRALWRVFRERGTAEREIVIDFTSGTKVASVVAVGSTYDSEIKAQYIQTSKPWGVVSYDVVLDHADSGGVGL